MEETSGIRQGPKSRRVREGVGWSHSTVDPEDNITSGEGRTPAVGVSKEGKDGRIAESFKRLNSSATLDGTM